MRQFIEEALEVRRNTVGTFKGKTIAVEFNQFDCPIIRVNGAWEVFPRDATIDEMLKNRGLI